MSTESLIQILEAALSKPELRASLIDQFQREVFNTPSEIEESEEWSILRDLAYDLDYYEPDPTARAESLSFYGDERAQQEIESSLKRLMTLRPH